MSQNSCLDCYRKHVATAMVFEDEAEIGGAYPLHKWLAIGELNAAAKEVVTLYPVLAAITRDYCLAYQRDDKRVPTIELLQIAEDLANEDIKKESQLDPTISSTTGINNSGEGNKSIDAIVVG